MKDGIIGFLLCSMAVAQDVPPPPRPTADGPSLVLRKPDGSDPELVSALASLKEILLSTGRVEWKASYGYRTWRQVTSVVTDPSDCHLRTLMDTSFTIGPGENSYFLESIYSVDVRSLDEVADAVQRRMSHSSPVSFTPSVYTIMINGHPIVIEFAEKSSAESAAAAFSRAAKVCRESPLRRNPKADAPTLDDTLKFLETKLGDADPVKYQTSFKQSDGSLFTQKISTKVTQIVADAANCRIRYDKNMSVNGGVSYSPNTWDTFDDGRQVISLKRVDLLEVTRLDSEPRVYQLKVKFTGGRIRFFEFPDEDIANRVARAFTHAVELCGGGSKDPF